MINFVYYALLYSVIVSCQSAPIKLNDKYIDEINVRKAVRALTDANLRQRKTKYRLQNDRQFYERELYFACKYKLLKNCSLRIDPNLRTTGCKNKTLTHPKVKLHTSSTSPSEISSEVSAIKNAFDSKPVNSLKTNKSMQREDLTMEDLNNVIPRTKPTNQEGITGTKPLSSPTYLAETTLRWETTVLTNSSNSSPLKSTIKQFAITDLRSSIPLLLATTSEQTMENRLKENIKDPEEPLTTTSEKILNTKIVSEPSSIVNSIKPTTLPFIVTNTSRQSPTTLKATPALRVIFPNVSPGTTFISTVKNKLLELSVNVSNISQPELAMPKVSKIVLISKEETNLTSILPMPTLFTFKLINLSETSIKASVIVKSTPSFITNSSTNVSIGNTPTESLTLSKIVAARTTFPQLSTANTTESSFSVFTTLRQSLLIIKDEPSTTNSTKVSPTTSVLPISPVILNPIMTLLANPAVSTPTDTTMTCIKGKMFSPCVVVDINDPNAKCKSPCQDQLVCVVLLGIGKKGNCLPDNSLPLL